MGISKRLIKIRELLSQGPKIGVRINSSKLVLGLFALLLISSCANNIVFDEYVTIPDEGWSMDSMAVFKVNIKNNSKPYDVYLNIRNRSSYPNMNLWLFVDVISPSGKKMEQKVDCVLADDDGRWLGDGWGDLYLVEIPYQRTVKFASYNFV